MLKKFLIETSFELITHQFNFLFKFSKFKNKKKNLLKKRMFKFCYLSLRNRE